MKPILYAGALLGLAAAARSDTIYLLNGRTLEKVTIQEETLTGVVYREDGKSGSKTVTPDDVLKIEYDRLPRLLDQAEMAIREGEGASAVGDLELFIQGAIEGSRDRRYPWAPAHAMKRLVDLYLAGGAYDRAIETADKLILHAPDSRHLPAAYLAKADALRFAGKRAEALNVLQSLEALIVSKSLSKRWDLEVALGRAQSDASMTPAKRRAALQVVAREAGTSYPIVRSRAYVAEGESYLEGTQKEFDKARAAFSTVVSDPKADESTKAGAYTGLGDCLFQEAVDAAKSGAPSPAVLEEALLNYLRVATVFQDQERYVPKALYFAGRAFDFLAETTPGNAEELRQRARDMYVRVIVRYPGTPWEAESRKQVVGR